MMYRIALPREITSDAISPAHQIATCSRARPRCRYYARPEIRQVGKVSHAYVPLRDINNRYHWNSQVIARPFVAAVPSDVSSVCVAPRVPLIPASLLRESVQIVPCVNAEKKGKDKRNTAGRLISLVHGDPDFAGSPSPQPTNQPTNQPTHPPTSLPTSPEMIRSRSPRGKREKGGKKEEKLRQTHTAARVAVPPLHPRDAVNSGQTCKPRRVRVGVPATGCH